MFFLRKDKTPCCWIRGKTVKSSVFDVCQVVELMPLDRGLSLCVLSERKVYDDMEYQQTGLLKKYFEITEGLLVSVFRENGSNMFD